MSRASAYALQIVERAVAVLLEDTLLHPDKWFVVPQTVEARPSVATFAKAVPLVAFEIDAAEPQDGGSIDFHRDLLKVTAWLKTASAVDPQGAITELAADFRRFLDRHRQLEDDAGTVWLESGQIHDRGYTLAIDFSAGGAGEGLAEFKFDVEYQWGATTA